MHDLFKIMAIYQSLNKTMYVHLKLNNIFKKHKIFVFINEPSVMDINNSVVKVNKVKYLGLYIDKNCM